MYKSENNEEKEYLEKYDPNKYRKPSVTVDFIVDMPGEGILVIKRKNYPFRGKWALPGGFLDVGKENTLQAALRELKEETSLDLTEDDVHLEGVYSDPDRDPRDHVVSVVYSIVLDSRYKDQVIAADDAVDAKFMQVNRGPVYIGNNPILAFDHDKILVDYLNKKYRNKEIIKESSKSPIKINKKRQSNLDILFKNS